MVFEMPCPDKQFVFVASTLEDETQADTEITSWADSHGYRTPKLDQVYTVYTNVSPVREWRLLERARSISH